MWCLASSFALSSASSADEILQALSETNQRNSTFSIIGSKDQVLAATGEFSSDHGLPKPAGRRSKRTRQSCGTPFRSPRSNKVAATSFSTNKAHRWEGQEPIQTCRYR